MADKHPYVTGPGGLVQVIKQFRKSFPATVSAETLKKLGFAPKNESYILNVLRFLGLIDQDGNKTEMASKVFSIGADAAFGQEFENVVREAYKDLFDLRQEDTWSLGTDQLTTFFRQSDQTTENVGKLQAMTFLRLAAFSGHGETPEPKVSVSKTPPVKGVKQKKTLAAGSPPQPDKQPVSRGKGSSDLALTVRIEINLPADGDQETYNRIFKSIRENLLGG